MATSAFGTQDLNELLQTQRQPSISIFLNLSPYPFDRNKNRLQVQDSIKRAKAKLEEQSDAPDVKRIFERLDAISEEQKTSPGQQTGLACFFAPDFERVYQLPTHFDDLVVVAPNFHTRPIVRYLRSPGRFYVLALSPKRVEFWQGSEERLIPIPLPQEAPTTLDELYGDEYDRERDVMSYHSGGSGGSNPVRYSQGSGHDTEKNHLATLFRRIDGAVKELLASPQDPVILAGVEEHHPHYKERSDLQNIADKGITGNVFDLSRETLHQRALAIAREAQKAQATQMLDQWEQSYKTGGTQGDPATIGELAIQGRIRALMVEEGRHIWGQFDREYGNLTVEQDGGQDPSSETSDIIDEIAETVLRMGGRVLTLSTSDMPTSSGMAAVLRGDQAARTGENTNA